MHVEEAPFAHSSGTRGRRFEWHVSSAGGGGTGRGFSGERHPMVSAGERARKSGILGARRRPLVDAHKSLVLSLIEKTCDLTLKELQMRLAERGHSFSNGSSWRFFDRQSGGGLCIGYDVVKQFAASAEPVRRSNDQRDGGRRRAPHFHRTISAVNRPAPYF